MVANRAAGLPVTHLAAIVRAWLAIARKTPAEADLPGDVRAILEAA